MSQLLRLIKDKFGRAPLVVMAIIPLMYGTIYLSAFWNPTDNLDRIPVALVNLDRGAVDTDGEPLDAGKEIVESLTEEESVDWITTDAEGAQDGLGSGRYYAVLTLPEGFSQAATTVGTDHAEHPHFQVSYNDALGYTTRTILSSVIREVRTAVSTSLGEKMAGQILVGLNDIRDGLSSAADGAEKLADGASQAKEGAGDLAGGTKKVAVSLRTLADSLAQATPGATSLADGSRELADGLDTVDASASALPSGLAKLSAGANSLDEGLVQAVDGAKGVTTAAAKLSSGAKTLSDGLSTLNTTVAQFPDQAGELVDNAQSVAEDGEGLATSLGRLDGQYARSVIQLRAELAKELPADSAALAAFDEQAASTQAGLGSATSDAQKLSTGADKLVAGAKAFDSTAGVLKSTVDGLASGSASVADGAAALATGTSHLDKALGQAQSGAGQLADGLGTAASNSGALTSGIHRLATGANSLADGNSGLASGIKQAAAGGGALADGSAKLAKGASSLNEGLGTLADGSEDLASGLTDALDQVPALTDAERDTNAEVLANPVELDTSWVHEAATNGEGFAPYFIGLTLYLGALIIWMIMRPLVPRAISTRASARRVVALSLRPALLISAVQALILLLTLRFGTALGLGLDVSHFWWFLGFGILTSFAYTALLQLLAVVFGNGPGRLLSLLLLLLQLASASGTYPAITSPAFFQWLNPILPMTYVVNGFRAAITGDLNAAFVTAVIYLVGLLVASVGLTVLATRRARFWGVGRLHPAVSL